MGCLAEEPLQMTFSPESLMPDLARMLSLPLRG